MIYKETLPNGQIYTYSDKYKIKQVNTGNIYYEAIDSVPHEYIETDELLPEEQLSDTEALQILLGKENK